jgi:hypothetical protein
VFEASPAASSADNCFFGRPLPGPGRLVMGLRVGSVRRGLSVLTPLEVDSALFCALLKPWKCCLSGNQFEIHCCALSCRAILAAVLLSDVFEYLHSMDSYGF